MIYWNNYAIVKNGIVDNILTVSYYDAEKIAQSIGENVEAINCSAWATQVGDIYKNGKFYDKITGKECRYIGTLEENLAKAIDENNKLKQILSDTIVAILEEE